MYFGWKGCIHNGGGTDKIGFRTFQNNIYSGLHHLHQLDCVFIKKLNLLDKFDLEQLKKLALILFYSFGSYDLVDYIVSKISKLEKEEIVFEYRNLMKNIKINKRY